MSSFKSEGNCAADGSFQFNAPIQKTTIVNQEVYTQSYHAAGVPTTPSSINSPYLSGQSSGDGNDSANRYWTACSRSRSRSGSRPGSRSPGVDLGESALREVNAYLPTRLKVPRSSPSPWDLEVFAGAETQPLFGSPTETPGWQTNDPDQRPIIRELAIRARNLTTTAAKELDNTRGYVLRLNTQAKVISTGTHWVLKEFKGNIATCQALMDEGDGIFAAGIADDRKLNHYITGFLSTTNDVLERVVDGIDRLCGHLERIHGGKGEHASANTMKLLNLAKSEAKVSRTQRQILRNVQKADDAIWETAPYVWRLGSLCAEFRGRREAWGSEEGTRDEVLQRCTRIREPLQILLNQIRESCPAHEEHEVYFGLRSPEDENQPLPELNLHLGVLLPSQDGIEAATTPIWYRAHCVVHPPDLDIFPLEDEAEPNSPGAEDSSQLGLAGTISGKVEKRTGNQRVGEYGRKTTGDGPNLDVLLPRRKVDESSRFCLAKPGQKFNDEIIRFPHMSKTWQDNQWRLHFPSQEHLALRGCAPITLQQWLRDTNGAARRSGKLPRMASPSRLPVVSVARAVSEAFLRLTSSFWPKQFSIRDIVVIQLNNGSTDYLEPYIRVRMSTRTEDCETTESSTTSDDDSTTPTKYPQILPHLGVVLIELGRHKAIPEIRLQCDNHGHIQRRHSSFTGAEVGLKNIKRDMGTHYAAAVEYCLYSSSDIIDMWKDEVQVSFYDNVISKLLEAEKCLEHRSFSCYQS